MRPQLLVVALMLTATAAHGQPVDRPRAATKAPITSRVLPTTRCGGLFLVKVTLDGHGPYTMMLDTGASISLVSKAVADDLLKTASTAPSLLGAATGVIGDQKLHVSTPTIGDIELAAHDAMTFDVATLRLVMTPELDGILGFGAFQRHLLVLDFAAGEVRVATGELDPADPDVFQLGKFEMPYFPGLENAKFVGTLTPRVKVTIADRPMDLIIDSGSGCGIELPSLDGLEFSRPPRQVGSTVTVDGIVPRLAGRLQGAVRLGRHAWTNPVIESSAKGATLGVAALEGFLVVIDHASGLAQLSRSGDPTTGRPMRSIGAISTPGESSWTITKVLPDTPAEPAGLRVGDQIVKVNGTPVSGLRCLAMSDLLKGSSSVTCEVLRDGQTLQVPVGVIDLVP